MAGASWDPPTPALGVCPSDMPSGGLENQAVHDAGARGRQVTSRLLREARDALGGSRWLTVALERAGITDASGSPYTMETVESWIRSRPAPPAPVFMVILRLGRVHVAGHVHPGEEPPAADDARLRRVEQKADALLQAIEGCMAELRTPADAERRERGQLQLQVSDLATRVEAAASLSARQGPEEPLVLG